MTLQSLFLETYNDLAVVVNFLRINLSKPFFLQVQKSKIKFCPACGSPTKLSIPDGDEKMRAVCSSCGGVHYENPKMVHAEQIK
jgi:hypothetical protein